MLESVSPYALLKLSKPKAPEVLVTEYDLYSAVQNAPSVQNHASPEPPKVQNPPEPAPQPPFYPPARRTHYIKDIGSRHDTALKSGVHFVQPNQRPDT